MQKRMTHAIIQKTAMVTIVKVVIVSKIKKKNKVHELLCSSKRHCPLSCKSLKVKKKKDKKDIFRSTVFSGHIEN